MNECTAPAYDSILEVPRDTRRRKDVAWLSLHATQLDVGQALVFSECLELGRPQEGGKLVTALHFLLGLPNTSADAKDIISPTGTYNAR